MIFLKDARIRGVEGSSKMMIKNKSELLSVGQKKLREDALSIIQSGIQASDPGLGTLKNIRVDGDALIVGTDTFDMKAIDHIYVVGAGKGSFPIAEALESLLGERISQGFVVVKKGEKRRLRHIEIIEAGHPIPDQNSIIGAEKIRAIAEKATEKDLVFAAITGGSSALVTLPPGDIQLEEIKTLTDLLLRCGAAINEINIIRKHLCKVKGGQLVAQIQPAEAITLTLNTQPEGGMPWPDMSLADPYTFQDAIDVLHYYDLWECVAPSIRRYLEYAKNSPELETVKSLDGMRTCILSVGDPMTSCEAAAQTARLLGYQPAILSTFMEGEAREVAKSMAGIAMEVERFGRPFKKPCALISGGEFTVTLSGNYGQGGPNQEFALGFAAALLGENEMACAAVDTDGTDGPTDIAGGIVDGLTRKESQKLGISLEDFLKTHDSGTVLGRLNSAIITGHTGTNVLDLRVILIR